MPAPFADRITARTIELASPVVVGLDPRPQLLKDSQIRAAGESPSRWARAYVAFGEDVLDGLVGVVPAVKIQIACYEALGPDGLLAYQDSVRHAKERGFLVIGDIKRGDIGISSEAYADAHFGSWVTRAGADADALTLNPYLGIDTFAPFLRHCHREGRGLFALVRTSNQSARQIQDLPVRGRPLFERVADWVEQWGADLRGACGYSSLGAVVGATCPEELLRIRRDHPHLILLVPGYGAQGGRAADVSCALDAEGAGCLIAASRSILRAYRGAADEGISCADAIRRCAEKMRDEIRTTWNQRSPPSTDRQGSNT